MPYQSVFIDESGDFGRLDNNSPHYLVGVLFHNRASSIEAAEAACGKLTARIRRAGYPEDHVIHMGPLIRNEGLVYPHHTPESRRQIFYAALDFLQNIDIKYALLCVDKREFPSKQALSSKIALLLYDLLRKNDEFVTGFDKTAVYYDNGQSELTQIIHTVFEHCSVKPEYKTNLYGKRLFQLIDAITSVERVAIKCEQNKMSKSERNFFRSPEFFQSEYLPEFRAKRIT